MLLHDEEDSCRQVVADQAVKAINRAMWRELDQQWNTEACANLDLLAGRLEANPGLGPLEQRIDALATMIGIPPWEARHVGWIAMAVSVAPASDRTRAVATAIRAFGIAVCDTHGLTSRCPCQLHIQPAARGEEPGSVGHRPGQLRVGTPGSRLAATKRETDDSQEYFDLLVETVLKGIHEAFTSLACQALNEAVARELDAELGENVAGALNEVASILDAFRGGLQEGVDNVVTSVIERSDLPPWAQQLVTRLIVSLVGLPINTPLHVAALSIRLFGACLEAELSAFDRATPVHEVVDDPRVRSVLDDLWSYLEPLHVKQELVDLFMRFDYRELVVGVLEPLRRPAPEIDCVVIAEVEVPRRASAGERPRALAAPHEAAAAQPADDEPDSRVASLVCGPRPLLPSFEPLAVALSRLSQNEAGLPPPSEEPGLPWPSEEPGLPPPSEEPGLPWPSDEPALPPPWQEQQVPTIYGGWSL